MPGFSVPILWAMKPSLFVARALVAEQVMGGKIAGKAPVWHLTPLGTKW
jgi:hypothetical protein